MKIEPEPQARRSIRLRGYDYASAGAYFVTIVTRERKCLFGTIVDGEIRLNQWGQAVLEEWAKSTQIRNEIELDAFVVMPNHVHGIIVITEILGRRPAGRPYNRDRADIQWVRLWADSNLR